MKFVFAKKKSVVPVADDAETEAPVGKKKKKVALQLLDGGKSEKKKKMGKAKAEPKAKAGKVKSKRKPVVVGKSVAEASPQLDKLIGRVDSALEAEATQKEKVNAALSTLHDFLSKDGKSSFKHPELGYYSVMKRGDVFFWRAKPQGRG